VKFKDTVIRLNFGIRVHLFLKGECPGYKNNDFFMEINPLLPIKKPKL
jgi:hypothetical protein